MRLIDLWPGAKGTPYDVRRPLWGQYWVWDRRWMRAAMAHNTLPAFILRGAATVAFQAAVFGIASVYGIFIGLYLMGVELW